MNYMDNEVLSGLLVAALLVAIPYVGYLLLRKPGEKFFIED